MSKELVFVIISFDKKFNNVFELAIKPAVEECGLEALKADGEDKVQRNIYDDIADKLELAKLVIVDISKVNDDNGSNINLDNVYYELGLAHGINKRFIFLTQNKETDIPFDLKNLSATIYQPDYLDVLKKDLIEKIPKALKEKPIKFFKNIEIKYKNQSSNFHEVEKKVIKNMVDSSCEISKLLYALNDFFYKEIPLKPAMKLKLKKLKYIEIQYKPAMLNEPIEEHIDITDEGARFLEHNRMVLK